MTRSRFLAMLACASATACSSSPTTPSTPRPSTTPPSAGLTAIAVSAGGRFPIVGHSGVELASCLQAVADPQCFSGARPVVRTAVAGATAPGAPGSLVATASGSAVLLTWSAPTSGDPVVTYILEAGSTSGLANLANITTNNTLTTFSASGVGNGTYYVRVRAQNAAGTSAASNEAILVVVGAACTSAPNAPSGLTSTVSGSAVTLSWNAPSGGCAVTSYILQAGSASGLSNLANTNIGTTATSYVAIGVGSGVYYVRVVAANASGQSPASNEVVTTVANVVRTVNCGDAIVVSTTLQSDLTCGATGIIIGADGITLDLNGHSLTGPVGSSFAGILITGHTAVSIVNGTVSNFGHGVQLQSGANRNIIRSITTNSQFFNGISVFGSSDNVIENCHANNSGSFGVGVNGASNGNAVRNCTVTGSGSSGIFIGGGGGQPPSFNNVVTGNSVHDNATTGPAISIFGSANNTVDGNDVVHNGVGTGGHGIGVSSGSNGNTISNNHASNNAGLGISINNTSLNNRVTGNTVSGNTSNGVDLNSSTGNSVANNTVTGNSSNGIAVTAASGNSVTANQVTGNALSGILIDSGSNTNQIFNNTVNGNNTTTGANSAGIFLGAATPAPRDNQIHDNTALGNARLDIEDRTTGAGTAGTLNAYASNTCVLGRPAALCVPPT